MCVSIFETITKGIPSPIIPADMLGQVSLMISFRVQSLGGCLLVFRVDRASAVGCHRNA